MANEKFIRQLLLCLLLVALLLISSASGKQMEFAAASEKEYEITLLAVSDDGTGLTGNLFLKLAPGAGNVFIQTEPVTKLDTRTSISMAKEIACQNVALVSAKCESYDFFFRLEANASIVGGPSAGAAAAALTVAALDNAQLNPAVTLTGTINSGGLIGQVGGLQNKLEAASKAGLKKVLIPEGERYVRIGNRSRLAGSAIDNSTVDLVDYGKRLGLGVIEVSDIQETLLQLTGKNYSDEEKNLEIDSHYSKVMDKLAGELCSRSHELSSQLSTAKLKTIQKNLQSYSAAGTGQDSLSSPGQQSDLAEAIFKAASNLTSDGMKAKDNNNQYSAASLCFGANVRYSYLTILYSNITPSDALRQVNATRAQIEKFDKNVLNAKTLSEMQVRGTVKERLQEARQLLDQSQEDLQNADYVDGLYQLAYAKERFGSANAWNNFLAEYDRTSDREIKGGNDSLRDGCVARLQEADEHIQYLDFYLPGILKSDGELGPVYEYLRESDYTSCIYRASLVKAKVNAMLSALSGNENLSVLIGKKINAAKKSIITQTAKGEFPIVSYSYYEYANSLKQTDQPSALLFAEYALELSNLDIYIKTAKKAALTDAPASQENGVQSSPAEADRTRLTAVFVIGVAVGSMSVIAILGAKKSFRRKRKLLVKPRTGRAR